jgi:cyanate permease
MTLCKVGVCGLLRNEQFSYSPKPSTMLKLTSLTAIVCRNFGEKRLIGMIFLMWVRPSILYESGVSSKTNSHSFSFITLQTISPCLDTPTFEMSFQTATSPFCRMWAGVTQGGIMCPIIFILHYVPSPSCLCHVERWLRECY